MACARFTVWTAVIVRSIANGAHTHTVKNYKTREIGYFLVNITAVAYGTRLSRIYFGGLYSLSNSAKHNDWKVYSPGTLPDLIHLLTFKSASCWVGTLPDLIHLLTFKSLLVVGWESSLMSFISSSHPELLDGKPP